MSVPPDEQMPLLVREIMARAGLADAFAACLATGDSFHISVEPPQVMRLVIEVVDKAHCSVAFYGEQNGDPMRGPEIVFQCSRYIPGGLTVTKATAATMPERWLMKEFTNDYLEDGYSHWPQGVGIQTNFFPDFWAGEIRESGYLEFLVIGHTHSSTHGDRLKLPAAAQAEEPTDTAEVVDIGQDLQTPPAL